MVYGFPTLYSCIRASFVDGLLRPLDQRDLLRRQRVQPVHDLVDQPVGARELLLDRSQCRQARLILRMERSAGERLNSSAS